MKKYILFFFFFLITNFAFGQVTLPYTEDFEGTGNKGWTLVNGSANKWFVGSAVNNGGSRSLYISDDASGANNNYSNTTSVNHAYIDFSVPAGVTSVGLSFDWRANGQTNYVWWFSTKVDYLQVWLVPVSFTPAAGNAITTGSGRTLVASLNGSTSFAKDIYNLSVTAGSNMRLVFSWINDSSTLNQNAAAIDNVHLSSCTQGAMYINDVKFIGSLNPDTDNTSGYTPGGTADYTALQDKGKQVPGGGMNVFVETLSSVTNYLGSSIEAWIDWNKDGTYSSGEKVYTSSAQAESTTFGFVVPDGTVAGPYKIKISASFEPSSRSNQTCVGSTFTETEIYSFDVINDCDAVISSVNNNYSCGTGTVTLSAVGNGTSYKWYTTRFGGSPIAGATSSTYTTLPISSTTTYYVTAVSGTFESVYRTPVIASVIPTTSLSLSTNNAEICGENSSLIISATGDKEEYEFFKEGFESGIGASKRFNGVTVTSTGDTTYDNRSRWTQKSSAFIPTGATWKPAISSGPGTNQFAFATSDINDYVEPNKVNTALSMNTSYAIHPLAQNMLNLYMTFDLYYSWYGDQNATTKDNLFIEISTDGGNTWIATTAATPDTNIRISKDNGLTWSNTNIVNYRWGNGTRFENLLVDLSYYRTQSNFSVRFRYNCGWGDGIALDNVRIYGDRPLPTAPTWSASGITFYQSNCSTPLLSTDKTSSVCIKPTLDELENNASWNIIANVVLHNGCSGIGSVTISNDTKVWNQPVSVNDWGVTNWKPSSPLPNLTKCVVVRTPVILPTGTTGTHGFAKNVVVKSGGKLTINPKSSLTIQNYLKNEAAASDVLVESDANLLQNNDASVNEGNITVKRNAKMKRLDYTYWGSPVSGQKLRSFSPATLNTRFYVYNEANDYFDGIFVKNTYPTDGMYPTPTLSLTPVQPEASYDFEKAKGYAVRSPNNFTTSVSDFMGNFVGTPNNGVIKININKSLNTVIGGNTYVHGINLISNPYPSNIDLDKFFVANPSLEKVARFWTNINPNPAMQGSGYPNGGFINNYAFYNIVGGLPAPGPACEASPSKCSPTPTNIVKVGQGFLVHVASSVAPGTNNIPITFNNSIRSATNSGSFFNGKIANATKDRYWLELKTPLDFVTPLLVGYVKGSTNAYDEDYDVELNVIGADSFYTILDNKKLGIQGRKYPVNTEDVVSLGAIFHETGMYMISLTNKEGVFANGQEIYLRDNLLGVVANLSQGAYSFSAQAGEVNNRFEILYNYRSLGTDTIDKAGFTVYKEGNDFVIKANETIKAIKIYDASGKLIYKFNANSKEHRVDATKYQSGVYMIDITTSSKSYNKKIIK